jgi:hypothetical protein
VALTTFAQPFPVVSSVTEGITANAGGGQSGAVVLTTRYNSVTVVATAADSVILPPFLTDLPIFVSNDAANALAVFPYLGQQIGSGAINASVSVAAGKTAMFVGAGTAGKWRVVVSA